MEPTTQQTTTTRDSSVTTTVTSEQLTVARQVLSEGRVTRSELSRAIRQRTNSTQVDTASILNQLSGEVTVEKVPSESGRGRPTEFVSLTSGTTSV